MSLAGATRTAGRARAATRRPGASPPIRFGRPRGHPMRAAGALTAAGALAFLLYTPHTGDLAAQTARAQVFAHVGMVVYWTRWYGGINLPGYSLVTPWLMGWLSPEIVAAAAAVVTACAAGDLLRHTRRPVLGACAVGVGALLDIYSGRVTEAVGVAFAVIALALLARRHPVAATVVAVLAALASPVAGLDLGLVAAGVVLAAPGFRRAGFAMGAAVTVSVVGVAWLFTEHGFQPFSWRTLVVAVAVPLVVAVLPGDRLVRVTALVVAVATALAFIMVSPIGSNITRLAMLNAIPALLATSELPPRRLALVALLLFAWPASGSIGDLYASQDAASAPSYYAPLMAELARLPQLATHRVEVVAPRVHWQAAVVAARFSLARGWERQIDEGRNPEFYDPGALTPRSYHAFLTQMAVAYVALPDARLDFDAVAEGRLVRRGLPYLQQIWHSGVWTLYRVRDPSPMATGVARVVAQSATGVSLVVSRPGTSDLRLAWSPYLRLTGVRGCLAKDGLWTRLVATSGGRASVSGHFSLTAGITRRSGNCPS